MQYLDMRTAFHRSDIDDEALYRDRIKSDEVVLLDIPIAGYPGFFLKTSEIYDSVVRTAKADKEGLRLYGALPTKPIEQFTTNSLIDEIVLTNEIEGVRSTRREISDVLQSLQNEDRKMRFRGLVNKYLMLNSGKWDAVVEPKDIRDLYDQLVLDEVLAEKKDNAPDGELFRAGEVSVYDAADREVHRGLYPESAIYDALERSLRFLNSGNGVDDLMKIAAFHFLFGYIHPFYDGNGRTNRFISSQYLSNCCEPLVGYSLSYTIKEKIGDYNKAFAMVEHPLNRGDLTPFITVFCEIIAQSLERASTKLREKKFLLEMCMENLGWNVRRNGGISDGGLHLAEALVQTSLFAEEGTSVEEMTREIGVSRATVYKILKELDSILPIKKGRDGREVRYWVNIDDLCSM